MGIPKERKELMEKRNKLREQMKSKVISLWNEGYRKSVIAQKVGLPESTIRLYIQEANIAQE